MFKYFKGRCACVYGLYKDRILLVPSFRVCLVGMSKGGGKNVNRYYFVAITVIASLVSNVAFAIITKELDIKKYEGSTASGYISLRYLYDILDDFSDTTNITTSAGAGTMWQYNASNSKTLSTIQPSYKASHFGFEGAFGYIMGNFRCDVSGGYIHSPVDDDDFEEADKDLAKYVEIHRDDDVFVIGHYINFPNTNPPYSTAQIKIPAGLKVSAMTQPISFACTATESSFCSTNTSSRTINGMKVTPIIFDNSGITNIFANINGYYDLHMGNIPVVPYVGIGVGVAYIEYLGMHNLGIEYKVATGVSYAIGEKIKAFIGYRYMSSLQDKFDKVKLPDTAKIEGKDYSKDVSAAEVSYFFKSIDPLDPIHGPIEVATTTSTTGIRKDKLITVSEESITFNKHYAVQGVEIGLMLKF